MLENCIFMTIIMIIMIIMNMIIKSMISNQKQRTRKLFKPHEEQPPQLEEKRGLGHNVFLCQEVQVCKIITFVQQNIKKKIFKKSRKNITNISEV